MSFLADADNDEVEVVRKWDARANPAAVTQLRCSECDHVFEGLSEEEAETCSEDVECERCFASHMGWAEEPEGELPF